MAYVSKYTTEMTVIQTKGRATLRRCPKCAAELWSNWGKARKHFLACRAARVEPATPPPKPPALPEAA